MRIFLLLFISINSFSDVSFGELEDFVIESDYDTRKIQIYYPNNKLINSDTLFILMNDGEELFNAADSWHNMEWGIDEKLKQMLYTVQKKVIDFLLMRPKDMLSIFQKNQFLTLIAVSRKDVIKNG